MVPSRLNRFSECGWSEEHVAFAEECPDVLAVPSIQHVGGERVGAPVARVDVATSVSQSVSESRPADAHLVRVAGRGVRVPPEIDDSILPHDPSLEVAALELARFRLRGE